MTFLVADGFLEEGVIILAKGNISLWSKSMKLILMSTIYQRKQRNVLMILSPFVSFRPNDGKSEISLI